MKKTYIQLDCKVITVAIQSHLLADSNGKVTRGSENGDPEDGESLSRETFFGGGSQWSYDEEE